MVLQHSSIMASNVAMVDKKGKNREDVLFSATMYDEQKEKNTIFKSKRLFLNKLCIRTIYVIQFSFYLNCIFL